MSTLRNTEVPSTSPTSRNCLPNSSQRQPGVGPSSCWRTDLHERIALISPNQTASALYLSMTRFVREHAVVATHDASHESAAEWLHIRMETHEELVNAIIAGDTRRVKIAVEKHAGLLDVE